MANIWQYISLSSWYYDLDPVMPLVEQIVYESRLRWEMS